MDNRLFKRILSMAVAVFMVVSMLPNAVFALDTPSTDVEDMEGTAPNPLIAACPCALCNGTVPAWQAYTGDQTPETGHYYLTEDFEIPAGGIIIGSNQKVVINLNGNCLICGTPEAGDAASQKRLYVNSANATLDILDATAYTDSNGKYISGAVGGGDCAAFSSSTYGRGGNIHINNASAVVTFHSGKISDGNAQRGGNVYVASGTFVVKGGQISGGTTTTNFGADVMAQGMTSSRIKIYGGTITGITSVDAVCTMYSNLEIYGGTIENIATGFAVGVLGSNETNISSCKIYGGNIGKLRTTWQSKLDIYGGVVKTIFNDTAETPAVVNIYNGSIGTDPSAHLAPCACVVAANDGTYTVWNYQQGNCKTENCPYEAALAADAADALFTIIRQEGTHAFGEYTDIEASCLSNSAKKAVCASCGAEDVIENEDTKLDHAYDPETGICSNGCEGTYCGNNSHTPGEAVQEDVVAPTCQTAGSCTLVVRCSVCNETISSEAAVLDPVPHAFDENDICINGCEGVAVAQVIYTDSTTQKYLSLVDAMKAASGTGATVHILRDTSEVWENQFKTIATAIKDVTITSAAGVTTTLMSASGANNTGAVYFDGVTFDASVNLVSLLYTHFVGTNNVYGKIKTYIFCVSQGGTTNIYGAQGGYLEVTGNLFINSNETVGRLNVYGDGSDTVVVNANSASNKNSIAIYSGNLYVENAVVRCDTLLFSAASDVADQTPTIILNNAVLKVEGTTSTLTGEYTVQIKEDAAFTLTGNSRLVVSSASATFYVEEGEKITLEQGSTIATAVADLQNVKILTDAGCVYYTNGVYSAGDHTVPDTICTEDRVCSNCSTIVETAPGHTLIKTEAKPDTCTAAGNSAYWTCEGCGRFYSDENGENEIAENTWIIDEITDHAYDENNMCVNGCGNTKCQNNGHTPAAAVKENETAATCTESGVYDNVVYCSVCNAELSRDTIPVAATGHSHEAAYTPATNKENAYTTYTCACGDSYVVVEENTMLHFAVNQTTGESYATVQAALDAASKGDTVKLLKDAEADFLYVGTKKTLDLNGKTLTANIVSAPFATSYIIDSTNGQGLLAVDKRNISLNSQNTQLPLWYAEGARFVDISFVFKLDMEADANGNEGNRAYYRFAIDELADETILDEFLANGSEGTGISIRVKVQWDNASGEVIQYFTFDSDMVVSYFNYASGWNNAAFRLKLTGVAGLENVRFTAEIVSAANTQAAVVIGSASVS